MTSPAPPDDPRDAIIEAALGHVPFDGWSDSTLRAAAAEAGIAPALAEAMFPRGGVDLARAFHARGDRRMLERLRATDLSQMRFRDRVATAVRYRLEAIDDREAARRGATLFALPRHAAEGAQAIWTTADLIWEALGDTSDDANWYSKRAILSGVFSATFLFWLGDESADHAATWAFLDRRIEEVMRFEQAKGAANRNPLLRAALAGPLRALSRVRPPARARRDDLPGLTRLPPKG
ncbi:COQ9 family protein [Rhodobacteraceae bacterium WD3A24]|nr:COQ9 family protein [Rhodobacteraceae bacterium WD3A24]